MPSTTRYTPQTTVEAATPADGEAAIVIGFRRPVRRVKRLDCDLRIAMTADEATNLYYRLGRALERQRRTKRQAAQGATGGE